MCVLFSDTLWFQIFNSYSRRLENIHFLPTSYLGTVYTLQSIHIKVMKYALYEVISNFHFNWEIYP